MFVKKVMILIFLCFVNVVYACEEIEEKYQPIDSSSIILCRTEYELAYSYDKKSADWVGEHLTSAEVDANEIRINLFKPDEDIPEQYRSELNDYANSGYDRGHLAPAGDMATIKGMVESFYLSNMIPQDPGHNRGIWNTLEKHVRQYALDTGEVLVFTGPIYHKESLRIGRNRILVPWGLFKVVYFLKTNESLTFIIPNARQVSKELPKYISTLEEVKAQTGIIFLPNLNPKERRDMD